MKYQEFIFENYQFNKETKELILNYSFDQKINFSERYFFDFEISNFDKLLLDAAIQNLFFLAGISYFKLYPFAKIIVKNGSINSDSAKFLNKTYQKGLGEFFYINNLDPNFEINFPANSVANIPINKSVDGQKLLIGIGGGKDSLVTVELLKKQNKNLAIWSVNNLEKLKPLIDKINLPFYYVERNWDKQLIELNKDTELYNGHIPISAILAAVGSLIGVLSNNSDIIVSNENSANEPTLNYQGVDINHQYSKSIEFESDWQNQSLRTTGENIKYYSALRPFSEVAISKMFSKIGFNKYQKVFSSCNNAFTHYSDHLYWDGTCPKCAFIFLALTPFLKREDLEELFSGKNLLLSDELIATYNQLLGIDPAKPLECVGEIKESRMAMQLAFTIYPQLKDRYNFILPPDYNFEEVHQHLMPANIFRSILDESTKLLN